MRLWRRGSYRRRRRRTRRLCKGWGNKSRFDGRPHERDDRPCKVVRGLADGLDGGELGRRERERLEDRIAGLRLEVFAFDEATVKLVEKRLGLRLLRASLALHGPRAPKRPNA